jgi:hypothetical protein
MGRDIDTAARALLALGLALAAAGCRCGPEQHRSGADERPQDCRSPLDPETRTLLERHESDYLEARRRATAWLDRLEVDPAELRARGIKGKKKLVELLDAYAWMSRCPLEGEREALERRVRSIVAVTDTEAYHDMGTIDDRQFKQDATSYMRAAYLMDELGLDTTFYREQIAKVKARYDGHMPRRGPAQRMIFHVYYQHFGLEEPFPLDAAFDEGVISRRPDPSTLGRMRIYHLAHEIFMPYRYGRVRQSDFFDPSDVDYLGRALPVLVRRRIGVHDPDLVAELVLCMEYLDLEADPAYREGLAFLLDSQSSDGSWGSYPRADRRFGRWATYHVYLHTTKLALSALINAWRCPE